MTALLLLAFQLAATPIQFDQAKSLADAYEASLTPSARSSLIKVQGDSLDAAFAKCGNLAESPIKPFTVVAHVNELGMTDQTWLKGDTALAKCVQKQLSSAKLLADRERPFYTSYEFSFEP